MMKCLEEVMVTIVYSLTYYMPVQHEMRGRKRLA